MSKTIIVSNRLPVTVKKDEDDNFSYQESIGGLSTGLKSYHQDADSVWVGWPGLNSDNINSKEEKEINKTLTKKYQCLPVFLSEEEMNLFYFGFSNSTLWPLFHYFNSDVKYDFDAWEGYKLVNKKFYESIIPLLEDDSIIWVHDYQLMLLPQMLKDSHPNVKIGFFLHIPFPSYEIFRLLIWREEILLGLLGSDLIGFHTYSYVRHFLNCVRNILGLENDLNVVSHEDRVIKAEAFPMGIDYERFATKDKQSNLSTLEIDLEEFHQTKNIISIDRLDYTKGIPQRIKAFSKFLKKFPEFIGQVRLILIVAPSRETIDSYDSLLKEIKENVSETNGEFGTISWMPVWFFYRSFSQDDLISLYKESEVLLVTPLRDGMNLVAKEYIAAHNDYLGMVVISETAGAASELGEAVVVNPNNYNAIAAGIKQALTMPKKEIIAKNQSLHRRLQRYNVNFWADEFIQALKNTSNLTEAIVEQINIDKEVLDIDILYKKAKKRILYLDYDGTLVGFKSSPSLAVPDAELKELLRQLIADPKNTVVLISGRERTKLFEWFHDIDGLNLVGCHGLWIKYPDQKEWISTSNLDNKWKETIRPVLELFSDRVPGSFVEEKSYTLVWHYRQSDADMVSSKINEIKATISEMIKSSTLMIQEGHKVLEVKDIRANKGHAASFLYEKNSYDFVLAAGDDSTDEEMFINLPEDALTIKVGIGNTVAGNRVKSWKSMRKLLNRFLS